MSRPTTSTAPAATTFTPAAMAAPALGAPVAAIDTPALVIDLDAMERNIATLAACARARGAALAGRVRLAIAVDARLGVERLAAALHAAGTRLEVFVEIDVGQGRCGVAPAGSPPEPAFEHALFVKTQVMSQGAARAVVDAGHKAHAIDSGLPGVWPVDARGCLV